MYSNAITQVLEKEHKNKPTLIQKRTYDAIRNGASIVGLAKTGTGKTLAYGLPVMERIAEIGGRGIILEPTTELAIQTRNNLLPYAKSLGLKTIALVGAGNRKRQLERLKKEKPEIIIATPGRFFDFLSENRIKYQDINALVIDEADDYYFPPITGTYLRFSRFLIAFITYFLTPTFLLLMQNQEWIPEAFDFIRIQDEMNLPLLWQFLVLELAIDGLRLAAVNTPNMLSTPLSVMAALVLGEFSVNSGWFNSEVMLYMAFVAIANYTQSSYELGYALKFMRMINLIATALFGLWGYIGAILLCIMSIACNRTVANTSYIYPLIPFHGKELMRRVFRLRLPGAKQ